MDGAILCPSSSLPALVAGVLDLGSSHLTSLPGQPCQVVWGSVDSPAPRQRPVKRQRLAKVPYDALTKAVWEGNHYLSTLWICGGVFGCSTPLPATMSVCSSSVECSSMDAPDSSRLLLRSVQPAPTLRGFSLH